jgi:hypothetical protein
MYYEKTIRIKRLRSSQRAALFHSYGERSPPLRLLNPKIVYHVKKLSQKPGYPSRTTGGTNHLITKYYESAITPAIGVRWRLVTSYLTDAKF